MPGSASPATATLGASVPDRLVRVVGNVAAQPMRIRNHVAPPRATSIGGTPRRNNFRLDQPPLHSFVCRCGIACLVGRTRISGAVCKIGEVAFSLPRGPFSFPMEKSSSLLAPEKSVSSSAVLLSAIHWHGRIDLAGCNNYTNQVRPAGYPQDFSHTVKQVENTGRTSASLRVGV